MANFSDIAIRIAADFVGIGAFKKADTAVDKLYKSTKRLGAAFGVTFSGAAIARFGAESVRAFANEERQIASLTATVKSLGLAFKAGDANAYIEDLERLTGITREELQPAFQKLITQTGSITKAQKILNTAIKVSFSGLMSTEEAAQALTQAYVGNVKGLKQFNLGLTNAELAAMSFDGVLEKVSKTYDSQFDAALDTTQVKLDKFNIAIGNAKENVGSGLVDAFADFAGSGDVDKANSAIERFSLGLADVIRNGNILAGLEFFANPAALFGRILLNRPNQTTTGPDLGNPAEWRRNSEKIIAAEKKARDAALKRERERLALLKKQTDQKKLQIAIDKAQSLLGKAENVFDLERISVAAAQQNATLTENERKRLEIKQAIFNLEDAIASKDTAKITSATNLLNGLLSQFNVMQKQDALLGQIKTAFDALGINKDLINLDNLDLALAKLKEMNLLLNGTKTPSASNNIYSPTLSADIYKKTAGLTFADVGAKPFSTPMSISGAGSNIPSTFESVGAVPFTQPMSIASQTPVIVQITDNAQKLVDLVTFATQNNSANGTPVALYRNATNLAW